MKAGDTVIKEGQKMMDKGMMMKKGM